MRRPYTFAEYLRRVERRCGACCPGRDAQHRRDRRLSRPRTRPPSRARWRPSSLRGGSSARVHVFALLAAAGHGGGGAAAAAGRGRQGARLAARAGGRRGRRAGRAPRRARRAGRGARRGARATASGAGTVRSTYATSCSGAARARRAWCGAVRRRASSRTELKGRISMSDCIFCRIAAGEIPADVVRRRRRVRRLSRRCIRWRRCTCWWCRAQHVASLDEIEALDAEAAGRMLRFIAAAARSGRRGGERLPGDRQQRPRRRPGGACTCTGTSSAATPLGGNGVMQRARRRSGSSASRTTRPPRSRPATSGAARRCSTFVAALKKERIDAGKRAHRGRRAGTSLKRERKRRAGGGRAVRARRARRTSPTRSATRSELLAAYMPEELSDDELRGARGRRHRGQTGAVTPKEMGKVMGVAHAQGRRARRRQDAERPGARRGWEADGGAGERASAIDLESNSDGAGAGRRARRAPQDPRAAAGLPAHAARQRAHLRGRGRGAWTRRGRPSTSCSPSSAPGGR